MTISRIERLSAAWLSWRRSKDPKSHAALMGYAMGAIPAVSEPPKLFSSAWWQLANAAPGIIWLAQAEERATVAEALYQIGELHPGRVAQARRELAEAERALYRPPALEGL